MGREIRMVPPNWEHPKSTDFPDRLQPMFDRNFTDAAREWKEAFAKWEAGERPEYCDDAESRALEYWEWTDNPPERKYYRPWKDEEAIWFQVWETVSEGTPVTPAFPTREALAVYLSKHGDAWDQKRGDGPWSIENARQFCLTGWAPSGVIISGKVLTARDSAEIHNKLSSEVS